MGCLFCLGAVRREKARPCLQHERAREAVQAAPSYRYTMSNISDEIEKFHSKADPPGVLQARLQALEERITERVLEGIRKENRRLIEEQKTLKRLLSIEDVAETLSKSKRWCETALREGELPAPLWIGGTRRWHPDALDAYIRRSAERRGGR